MASRSTSLLEKDLQRKPHSYQPKGQHSNTTDSRPVLGAINSNVPSARLPISSTARAKSEPKAYAFIEGRPDEHEKSKVRKENVSNLGPISAQNGSLKAVISSAPDAVEQPPMSKFPASSRELQLPHANTFPSTPSMRLPLADLIGNLDERPTFPESEAYSPEDLLTWIPNSSSEFFTPNRRKRKRARSSSPSCPNNSSQRQAASAYLPSIITAQSYERMSDADPAADLWQRYAGGRTAETGLKLPEFHNYQFQASPRPLETPMKGGGLRRWASTGNDWPSAGSKSKRRRREPIPDAGLWQDQQQKPMSGKSKVAVLVEKIQESLASQNLARSGIETPQQNPAPSALSPVLQVEPQMGEISSPTRSRLQTPPLKQVTKAIEKAMAPSIVLHSSPRALSSQAKPSITHQERLCQDPFVFAPLKLQSKAPLPAFKRPSINRTNSGGGRVYPTAQVVEPIQKVLEVDRDLDEFGDDFELSAEDLEELAPQPPVQRKSPHDISSHPNAVPESTTVFEHGSIPTVATVQKAQISNEYGMSDDDNADEFGCNDIDEDSFAQAEVSATQAYMTLLDENPRKTSTIFCGPTSSQHSSLSKDTSNVLQRYKVKQVIDGKYVNANGHGCQERLLMVEDERTLKPLAVALRDSWTQTVVMPSNIVHIAHIRTVDSRLMVSSNPPGQMVISDDNNSPLLVVHPDHMLSATTVADSFDCLRKAVLQHHIKATADTSKAIVYGKILHEIFQQALIANQWDDRFLPELTKHTMQSHLEGLWELGMKDTVLAVEEISTKMAELTAWAKVFVASDPGPEGVIDDKRGGKIRMSISKLIAIEEHIWSPRFGLKGNIDATVESTLSDDSDEPFKRLIAPFEVKTGRTTQSAAHRAQTALYTLLLSDRYDVAVEAGILYYLESSSMTRIAPPRNEMRQMMQQRNRIASHIHGARTTSNQRDNLKQESPMPYKTSQDIEECGLPAPVKNPFKCGKCYAQRSCFAYHALAESGTADSAGCIDDGKKNHSLIWREAVGHLSLHSRDSSHADTMKRWFIKWNNLLTLEESDQSRYRKELWIMSSEEREATGRCFGNLVLTASSEPATTMLTSTSAKIIELGCAKINRFTYVFARSANRAGGSFAEGSQLTVGEPVVVSSESGQWALANGYVVATSKHDITVAVDRKLGDARQRLESFDEARNQVLLGCMTATNENSRTTKPSDRVLYRLDKDEFSNGLALIRNNLVTLMSSHPIHTKLRGQIIDGHAPTFTPVPTSSLPLTQLGEMNEDQRKAVDKVMGAKDYALILGMPGTGKTTTIAHIIHALLAENKTILLTSFTHTAVDNILLKIRNLAPSNSILRLGVPTKIDPEVQTFCRLANTPWKTIGEIEEVYMGCQIVATTCMGTNHAVFRRRAFDVCIVDEASQITLPTSLGPLLHARKFVLVGDHYQLPPLVQNHAALEGGYDISLFLQLSEEQPEAVATLGEQYRMCEDIMTLSNELIYGGKLRCGNEVVARRTLHPTNELGLLPFHAERTGNERQCSIGELERGHCWLADITHSIRKVVFANTDLCGPSALEILTSGNRITNTLEATMSAQVVLALLSLGIPTREIGVITFYRSQLQLIRQIFTAAGIPSDVDIDSADRFQGRDKECIILSMVRSNETGVVGELLKDWRRINVAFTRARSKLIVLGSRRTLRNNELLKNFLALVDRRGWAMDLPKGADEAHAFNFSSSTNMTASHSTPGWTKSLLKPRSPLKSSSPSQSAKAAPAKQTRGVLTSSNGAGNRGIKIPGRVIKGTKSSGSAQKLSRQMQEQIISDIWEDMTSDDF